MNWNKIYREIRFFFFFLAVCVRRRSVEFERQRCTTKTECCVRNDAKESPCGPDEAGSFWCWCWCCCRCCCCFCRCCCCCLMVSLCVRAQRVEPNVDMDGGWLTACCTARHKQSSSSMYTLYTSVCVSGICFVCMCARIFSQFFLSLAFFSIFFFFFFSDGICMYIYI